MTAAVAVFAAALVFVLVVLVTGGNLADATDDVLPFAFAVAALLALAGWLRDRRANRVRTAAADERAREAEERVKDAEETAQAAAQHARRADRARRAEREWARELRDQVVELHHRNGFLSDSNDVRDLVLQVAMKLTEAKKGLLLAQGDSDRDGRLDLVAAHGFGGDPAESEVAQRFAQKVIERDEIVREDSDRKLAGDGAPADDEIESLIAIPVYVQEDFHGIVICANRPGGFEELEDEVLLALGNQAGAVLQNRRMHGELRGSYLATVRVLADAIECKDPAVRVHSDEVASYVAAVADELTMEAERREQLIFASLLHDVGKIGISERILMKPGRLTDEERNVVELHPRIGCRLIEQVPALRGMATSVLYHHERWDGTGYPSGLKGEEIPLEARIICVADCFSAMTSDRPYSDGMSVEDACEELERNAGTQFDPRIVQLFTDEVRKRPPAESGETPVEAVFADPEIGARRNGTEPRIGQAASGITDSQTLLYSHRFLHEVADSEAARAAIQGEPFAVLMFGLEDLAETNASEGFAAGDAALRGAAMVLQDAAARCEGTAARYSGRRLALLVPRGDEEMAQQLAGEIAAQIEAQGRRVCTSAAVWEPGDSGTEVVGRARLALRTMRTGVS